MVPRFQLLIWCDRFLPPGFSYCLLCWIDGPQHAHAAELLIDYLRPGARVIDVGSGSGYHCSVFQHLVSAKGSPGKVVGIEHVSELVDWSKEYVRIDGLGDAVEKGDIALIAGDGRQGRPRSSWYDI